MLLPISLHNKVYSCPYLAFGCKHYKSFCYNSSFSTKVGFHRRGQFSPFRSCHAKLWTSFDYSAERENREREKDVWMESPSQLPKIHFCIAYFSGVSSRTIFPVLIWRRDKPLIRRRNYHTRNCRWGGRYQLTADSLPLSFSLLSSRNWRAFTRAKWRSRDNGEPVSSSRWNITWC